MIDLLAWMDLLLLHPEVDGQALKREGPPKRASFSVSLRPPVEPRTPRRVWQCRSAAKS